MARTPSLSNQNEVADTSGNAAPAAILGTFSVLIQGSAPRASYVSSGGVTSPGGTTKSFAVTYSDYLAVKVSTLDNSDILVTGPNAFCATGEVGEH